MPFTPEERRLMLAEPGIGPTVIERLEAAGFGSIEQLRAAGADAAVRMICARVGSDAWANRRQALECLIRRSAERPATTGAAGCATSVNLL